MSAGEIQLSNTGAVLMKGGQVRFENCACCVGNGIPGSPYIAWDSPYSIPSCAQDLAPVLALYPLSTYYPPRLHRMCLRGLIYCPLVRTGGTYASIPTPRAYRLADCKAGTGFDTWQEPPYPTCDPVPMPVGKPFVFDECDCAGLDTGGLFLGGGTRPEAEIDPGDLDCLPTKDDLNAMWSGLPKCYPIYNTENCCGDWSDGVEHVLQLIVCYVRWTIRDRATKTIQAGGLSHVAIFAYRWIRGRCGTISCT